VPGCCIRMDGRMNGQTDRQIWQSWVAFRKFAKAPINEDHLI